MAVYNYKALDANGRTQRGVITSDSVKAARRELRSRALTPVEVNPSRLSHKNKGPSEKLSDSESVLFTRQLAMLTRAGSTVEGALAAIADTSRKGKTRSIVSRVRSQVMEGQSLADAMRSERSAFSPLYCAIVSAGESASALDDVLSRLADYQEKSAEMRGKVVSALIYPIVLSVVALLVIVALLVFVVPRVVEQFDTFGQELPLLTRMMINTSNFLQSYGLIVLGSMVALAVVFNRLLANENVKRSFDRFCLNLPVVGDVVRSVASARFARTFATLSTSGAPVIDCLNAAKETTPNLVLKDAVEKVTVDVREGAALNTAMERTGVFPPLMTHMAAGGEASGQLGEMFDKGAEYLERDFEKTSGVALGLLEPFITVFMGGVVLLIILSIMLPILQLNSGNLL